MHGVQVEAQFAHADTMVGKRMLGLVVLPGRIQQRLGRNAAHVQAGAAECRLVLFVDALLDAGGVEAQLRAANRGDVTAGAATDDDDIVFISHNKSFSTPARYARRRTIKCPAAAAPGPR